MRTRGNWEVWQVRENEVRVVYRGLLESFPADELPVGHWSIALPLGGWLRKPVVLNRDGFVSRHWKLATRKSDEMLDVTDNGGITVERTIPWFLKFLELDFAYHPDYGSTSESWLDALDGLWIMTLDQKKQIAEIDRGWEASEQLREAVGKERDDLRREVYAASVDRTTLAEGIEAAIRALMLTKRFGKSGQASKEAMAIRKKLFGVYRDVLGQNHPAIQELAKIQAVTLGHLTRAQ